MSFFAADLETKASCWQQAKNKPCPFPIYSQYLW